MTSYDQAVDFLDARLSGSDGRVARVDLVEAELADQLRSFERFLASSGWLEAGIPIIHIAGSKGKGSTAAKATFMLQAGNVRAGTFTSPHVYSWTERIAVGDRPVSEEDFARLVEIVADAESAFAATTGGRFLNLFEFLTAMAIVHFIASACDVMVIEVGLGGRFDPTNVLTPAISVITRLELEHVAILGPTLKEIAWNKAGIIKPGVPTVTCAQQQVAMDEIIATADRNDAPLFIENDAWSTVGRYTDFTYCDQKGKIANLTLGIPGQHQVQNAGLAIAAIRLLGASGITVSETAIRQGLRSVSLTGRFERINHQGREIIFDGAHTPESASGLASTLADEGIDGAHFVIGMLADKDAGTFMASLRNQIASLALTEIIHPRSATIEHLAFAASAQGLDFSPSASVEDAMRTLLAERDSGLPIVVTGSMGTVSEAKRALKLQSLHS